MVKNRLRYFNDTVFIVLQPKNDQNESFRKLNGGTHQVEWHLFLESWERMIDRVGFDKTFFRGFDERIGFIWILRNPPKLYDSDTIRRFIKDKNV